MPAINALRYLRIAEQCGSLSSVKGSARYGAEDGLIVRSVYGHKKTRLKKTTLLCLTRSTYHV